MPNGHHGSDAEWERLESPLRQLDGVIEAFAKAHSLAVSKNARGWPNRSMRWGDPLSRLIQIYLEDEKQLTFALWVSAYEDRDGVRYWKKHTLRERMTAEVLLGELPRDLVEAFDRVSSWSKADLEKA